MAVQDTPAAYQIIGTGPWRFKAHQAADGSGDAPFYFLRGGVMHTPWGTATWGAAGGGLVAFLCGRERPTHDLEVRDRDLGAGDPTSAHPSLRLVSRTTGEAFTAAPDRGAGEFGPIIAEKSADDEARAALAGREACADESADALRRRLVATGPWNLHSAELYLLRNGAAYDLSLIHI